MRLLIILGWVPSVRQTQVEICRWEVYWAVPSDNTCDRSRIAWKGKGMLNPEDAAVEPSADLTNSCRAGMAL